MGDWCVVDHFIVGNPPLPTPDWLDRRAGWAMRVGTIGPGIRLLQTTEKWRCQRLSGDGVIGICAVHDYLDGGPGPWGAFVPGWNCLLTPSPASADTPIFRGIARELGDNTAAVATSAAGGQPILCLRDTLRYRHARQTLMVSEVAGDEAPLARFVDAFVRTERHLHGRQTMLLCGLWTHAHGFVHTGRVTFDLTQPWRGRVVWEATGAHNPLSAPWSGPCAGLLSLAAHQQPLPVSLQRWPLAG